MDTPHSTVEIKINRFLMQYGPEQLIEWLDAFDFMVEPYKFKQFKKLEKLACSVFSITLADMHMLTRNDCTNAKRIISYISCYVIKLSKPAISKLLINSSLRSVENYIKDSEGWIENPRTNKIFYDAYTHVMEKFNIC